MDPTEIKVGVVELILASSVDERCGVGGLWLRFRLRLRFRQGWVGMGLNGDRGCSDGYAGIRVKALRQKGNQDLEAGQPKQHPWN